LRSHLASALESELFGHVRGAFTGATGDKVGMITMANGGTMFLDEIGELPKELQVKLLRTLQFGEVQPVGATRPQSCQRAIRSSDEPGPRAGGRESRFREDLLYRLNAITLQIPPLKDRRETCCRSFITSCNERPRRLDAGAEGERRFRRVLQQYAWPGNVRELENEAAASWRSLHPSCH
jgi:transcriptional regulator with PAS, ATPase and Fis domain